jgi:hypothetical protein
MTIETHIQQALDRVRDEQVAIEEKQTGYERFVREVEAISAETLTHNRSRQTTAGAVATMTATPSNGADSCQRVRERFADTVRPHSTADVEHPETLLETIAVELSEQIAVALAPQNATTGFTAGLKNGVLSEAAQRQRELRAMERALDREAASLIDAKNTLDGVLQWLTEANETRLTTLDFAALRARHDRLDGFRNQCGTIARERQSLLHATTSADGEVGIAQQELVGCLYVAFPVAYPVLSTVVRVEQVCLRCQRAIRDHLVRRV